MTKAQERWKLDMMVKSWVYRGNEIKKYPMGVHVDPTLRLDYEPITWGYELDEPKIRRSIKPSTLEGMITKTGLSEQKVRHRLRTRGSLIREWIKDGLIPEDKYQILLELIRENKYIQNAVSENEDG